MTALHKDPYENIYVQVVGQKHFVLVPPVACAVVDERELWPASYVRGVEGGFEIRREGVGEKVPVAMWDPDVGSGHERFVKPVRVTLRQGDMLYLPALW